MTNNSVSKTEGHRERIEGFEKLRIDGQTERMTDRKVVINSEYEKPSLFYFSHTLLFISFSHSWAI
jgi:hypothetical protein